MWREPKQLLSGVAQIALAYSDREDPLCSTSHSGSFRFERRCPSCGYELGYELNDLAKYCPRCGYELNDLAKYCPRCGYAMLFRHLGRLSERSANRQPPCSTLIHQRQEAELTNLIRQSQRLQPQRQRHQGQLVRFVLRP